MKKNTLLGSDDKMKKKYTYFKEDNGYWIRDEESMKIIATGLTLGVAQNLVTILNNLANDVRLHEKELSEQYETIKSLELKNKQFEVDALNATLAVKEIQQENILLQDENEQLKSEKHLYAVVEKRNGYLLDNLKKEEEQNERLIKMLDNAANYMQKQHRDMPVDEFVDHWNYIISEGLDD